MTDESRNLSRREFLAGAGRRLAGPASLAVASSLSPRLFAQAKEESAAQPGSRVVKVTSDLWRNEKGEVDGKMVGRMVHESLRRLTGKSGASEAWKSLFSAQEKVGVKFNNVSRDYARANRPVLEAKLVTRTGLALSVETEFIENPRSPDQSEEDYKQDCEVNGAKRLLPRLKGQFPALPICLLLDSLYAGEPLFALCEDYDWRFLVVLKDGSIPTAQREFRSLVAQVPENTLTHHTDDAEQRIRWVNHIDYHGYKLHLLECVETPKDGTPPTRWLWATNIPISRDNALELANEGGRQRWRTENEGFNVQKRGGYAMEHAYAKDPQAAKNFYLLLQIAHLFAQLFECRMGGKSSVTRHFGSLRNLAAALLRAFLHDELPSPGELDAFLNTPIQVRLDTS